MVSKYFKPKKNVATKMELTTEPRSMDEINKEYSELIGKVGQAQYKAYIYGKEVEKLNADLERVNAEASARGALDAKLAAEKAEAEKTEQTEKAGVANG